MHDRIQLVFADARVTNGKCVLSSDLTDVLTEGAPVEKPVIATTGSK